MREKILKNLSAYIDQNIVSDLLFAYEDTVAQQRMGNCEAALTKGGRFVEHTLRAILFIQSGKVVSEIKSVKAEIQRIENDTNLHEALRLLIPRVAYGMIYNVRSKRDAVHVKEINPRQIDAALVANSASWIVAELIRIYHVSDEQEVAQCMFALSRTAVPFIESVDGEVFVSEKTPPKIEILLLLADSKPSGLSRKALGIAAKCSPSGVTKAVKTLCDDRYVHQSRSKEFFITGTGERHLAEWMTPQGLVA